MYQLFYRIGCIICINDCIPVRDSLKRSEQILVWGDVLCSITAKVPYMVHRFNHTCMIMNRRVVRTLHTKSPFCILHNACWSIYNICICLFFMRFFGFKLWELFDEMIYFYLFYFMLLATCINVEDQAKAKEFYETYYYFFVSFC